MVGPANGPDLAGASMIMLALAAYILSAALWEMLCAHVFWDSPIAYLLATIGAWPYMLLVVLIGGR